jgi:hypothetical protein
MASAIVLPVYSVKTDTVIVDALTVAKTELSALQLGGAGAPVAVTTTPLAVSAATHAGRTVTLSKVDGLAVTLPAATGSGAKYRFVIVTALTSGDYTFAVTGNDMFTGIAIGKDGDGDPGNVWTTAANSNRITLGGASLATGGSKGDVVEVEDIAADLWSVCARITQGGTEATPFSNV